MRMESYQKAGVLVGILGVIIGLLILAFGTAYEFAILIGSSCAIVSFITIFLVFAKNHAKGVGITLIVLGVLFNWLLLIPGIMAIRHKQKSSTGVLTP